MLEAGVLMNRLLHKTAEQPLGISNMNDLAENPNLIIQKQVQTAMTKY